MHETLKKDECVQKKPGGQNRMSSLLKKGVEWLSGRADRSHEGRIAPGVLDGAENENEQQLWKRVMSGDQATHLTVSYRDGSFEISSVYAVDEDTSRELGRHIKKPAGKDLQAWLEKKGCRLDWSGGPAVVQRDDDGSKVERYYRDGKPHREDGPAIVKRYADGTTEERYYRDGERHREDGPAVIKCYADGSNYEEYYRDGRKHREDGPTYVWHDADGTTVEKYYRDGKLHREDGPAFVRRNPDGTAAEEYFRDGKPHRKDTPA